MLQRKNNSQPQSNKPNEKRKRRKIGEKKTHKSFLGQIKQRTVKPSKVRLSESKDLELKEEGAKKAEEEEESEVVRERK